MPKYPKNRILINWRPGKNKNNMWIQYFLERTFKNVCSVLFTAPSESQISINHPELAHVPENLKVTSAVFASGEILDDKYGGHAVPGGKDISPPFEVDPATLPAGTKSLMIVVQDLDVPIWKPILHGLFYNISRELTSYPEGFLTKTPETATEFAIGKGAFGRQKYIGPSPIINDPPHRYFYQVFALDTDREFHNALGYEEAIDVLKNNAIGKGYIIGKFQRVWN